MKSYILLFRMPNIKESDTAVKVTTWGFGAKKIPVGPALHYVTQTLLWRYFRFSFLFSVLLFYKRFDDLLFFFSILDPIPYPNREAIGDPVRNQVRDPIRDPVRSRFYRR